MVDLEPEVRRFVLDLTGNRRQRLLHSACRPGDGSGRCGEPGARPCRVHDGSGNRPGCIDPIQPSLPGLGLDRRDLRLGRTDVPRAPRAQGAQAGCDRFDTGCARDAWGPRMRWRRVELRKQDRVRRRAAAVRTDDGDGADRASGHGQRSGGPRDRTVEGSLEAGAGRDALDRNRCGRATDHPRPRRRGRSEGAGLSRPVGR